MFALLAAGSVAVAAIATAVIQDRRHRRQIQRMNVTVHQLSQRVEAIELVEQDRAADGTPLSPVGTLPRRKRPRGEWWLHPVPAILALTGTAVGWGRRHAALTSGIAVTLMAAGVAVAAALAAPPHPRIAPHGPIAVPYPPGNSHTAPVEPPVPLIAPHQYTRTQPDALRTDPGQEAAHTPTPPAPSRSAPSGPAKPSPTVTAQPSPTAPHRCPHCVGVAASLRVSL